MPRPGNLYDRERVASRLIAFGGGIIQRSGMVRFAIQVAIVFLVVFFALKKGGRPERHVAIVLFGMLAAVIGQALVRGHWTQYDDIPWFRVAIDVVAFAIVLAIALRADRWWPLWVGSVLLLSVLAHLLRIVHAEIPPLVYAIMERWPFMIATVIPGLGTYLHARRERIASPN